LNSNQVFFPSKVSLDYSRVKNGVAATMRLVKAYLGTSNRLRGSRCGKIGSPVR